MDNRLEALIMRAVNADYKQVAHMLAKCVDSCCTQRDTLHNVYSIIYNGHLQNEECEEFVQVLKEVWSLEDTNQVAKKLDLTFDKYTKDEFRLAMHICYYDICKPLQESNITLDAYAYGRLADHYLSKHSLVDCFFK